MDFKLELDIPTTELVEPGWAMARYFQAAEVEQNLAYSSGLWFEPSTGTLLLRPLQMAPEWRYDPLMEPYKLRLADFSHMPLWEEQPVHGVMQSPVTDYYYRSKVPHNMSLLETLALTAIEVMNSANGNTMRCILNSNTIFPKNQGFMVSVEISGRVGDYYHDYIGIAFGDFFLSCNTNGGGDLYWSSDGSRSPTSWIRKRSLSASGALKSGGTSMVFGASVNTGQLVDIMVLPMGRGHIWIRVQNQGKIFNWIYTHQEAAWNPTDQCYDITAAGTVGLFTNPADEKNIGLQVSKIGYVAAGSYIDTLWNIGYPPSTDPACSAGWVRTMGDVAATATLLDESGNAWANTGDKSACRVRLDLSGDGTGTPWVDTCQVQFPPKIETYTPEQITVDGSLIQSVQIEDGERWDDQRITVVVRDNGTLSRYMTRGTVHGRFSIDDAPYSIATFTRPRTQTNKAITYLTLTGRNLGAHKLERRRFFNPPTFGGQTHPDAVKAVLELAGFAASDVEAQADTITLPQTMRQGGSERSQETEPKSQPQFNQPIREFIDWILENISGWKLRYEADEKWRYAPKPAPETASVIFYATTEGHALWYTDLEYEVEPAEGNQAVLIGQTDTGELIGNIAKNSTSISQTGLDQIVIIDRSLPDMDTLNACLQLVANKSLKDTTIVRWKGPFSASLKIGDGVWLENVGLVKLTGFSTETVSARLLDKVDSTAYEGELIS
jgi:hypothetical protein